MRIIKTGVSVALCLLAGYLLNQPAPIFACMAAIVVTQGSVGESLRSGVARIIATVVGCAIALVIMLASIENPYVHMLTVGLGCALTIYFCVLIKYPNAAALAGIIFVSLAVSRPDDKYAFALMRLIETAAGIAISVGVNVLLDINSKYFKNNK